MSRKQPNPPPPNAVKPPPPPAPPPKRSEARLAEVSAIVRRLFRADVELSALTCGEGVMSHANMDRERELHNVIRSEFESLRRWDRARKG